MGLGLFLQGQVGDDPVAAANATEAIEFLQTVGRELDTRGRIIGDCYRRRDRRRQRDVDGPVRAGARLSGLAQTSFSPRSSISANLAAFRSRVSERLAV